MFFKKSKKIKELEAEIARLRGASTWKDPFKSQTAEIVTIKSVDFFPEAYSRIVCQRMIVRNMIDQLLESNVIRFSTTIENKMTKIETEIDLVKK